MKPILKKVEKPEDKYLIITDLDGTFLSTGGNMTHHIVNNLAVKKVRELGHEFVIASGRSPQLIKPIYDHLKLDTPVIAFHGAIILDPTGKHKNLTLNNQKIPIKIVREIVAETNILNDTIVTELIGYGKSNSITKKEEIEYIDFDPYEVVFATKRDMYTEEIAKKLVEEKWNGKVKVKFLPGGSGYAFDMILLVAPDVDKSNALEKLSKYYKIPKERIIYFGDNYNDLNALEYAGNGVAMISGKKRVIDTAKYTTKYSNVDAGVGHFLFSLIKE